MPRRGQSQKELKTFLGIFMVQRADMQKRFWSLLKKKKTAIVQNFACNKQNFCLNININDYNLLTEMVVCGRGCLS